MTLTASEFAKRVIEPDQFVADPRAFVDVRLARSKGKASYSFIGPGVSQNSEQTINLQIPHGFNVGAASLPAGAINNPHLHFTAEVFICTRGSFRFTVGLGDTATSIDVGPGDVFSVPTWVFRSFENTGTEEGWVYTILGHDTTGGIIWAPDILDEGAETGLHLDAAGALIDTVNGESVDGVELMPRMTEADVTALHQPSADALASRLVTAQDRNWQSGGLLSGCLPGHAVEIAPLIGHCLSQTPNPVVPIPGHHSFCASWLRAGTGNETGMHGVDAEQVAYLIDGNWEVEVQGEGTEPFTARPAPGSLVSLPGGASRNLRSIGEEPATMVLVTAHDNRPTITFSDDIQRRALGYNLALDANGCLGPAHLIKRRGGTPSDLKQPPTNGRENE